MKIAIVDDEKLWIERTINLLYEHFDNAELIIDQYKDGNSFLKVKKAYEIVFLDIEMPGKDGFEIAEKYSEIFPESIIIILTSHNEMCNRGYMVNAFRYIEKKEVDSQIEEALISASKKLVRNRKININITNLGIVDLFLKDIVFIETDGRKLLVHTTKEKFFCNETMEQLDEGLNKYGFFRCHKSYIVNLDMVERFDKTFVFMKNKEKAMVSTRKYLEFKRKYIEHKFLYANC